MPFQRLLDSLLRLPGVVGALLLDSEGEVAIESGAADIRHRLIGAYQGIALATARRVHARYGHGATHGLACRYDEGLVVMRPLKDGYYLVVSLEPERPLAPALRATAELAVRLDEEL
jgi:predicted regulator of Ras-like GTPase activity (Roadblock/LC7/MglB family)